MNDLFKIGNKILKSRLFIGSGKYGKNAIITKIIKKSCAQVITVALGCVNVKSKNDNIIEYIPEEVQLLPNTSGARNCTEAVRLAYIGRELGYGNWIKIEVISDNKYLLPDGIETIKATEILAAKDFVVFPYISPDLMIAKALVNAGAAAIMPLGSPIGSNKGLKTKELLKILIKEIDIPVIIDAGIGKPSDACEAMELGFAACLINTAIASAKNPVLMAEAFGQAVASGRKGYLAGLGEKYNFAQASSPLTDFLGKNL